MLGKEAVGTVNTAGQPSTTSQDQIIKLVQVLLLLHKQVKMELKQTLPTTKVKALQKLQELKLIKPMLHKQTLVQILPDKITKLLVPQGTQTAGTGQTAPTTATGDTQAKPHAETADQGNGATVTLVPQNDATSPAASTKPGGNDWSRCYI